MRKKITYRFDMKTEKTIKIATHLKDRLSIELLKPLQGELKILTDENYKKLKAEIIEDGFSFAIHVWEDEKANKIYILDGHQRHETLKRMKAEGYKIPEVPVVFVEADDLEHAKRKLAAAASQYGTFNQDGAEQFFGSFKKFSPSEFTKRFNMPEINHGAFKFSKPEPKGEPKKVEFTAGEGGKKEKTPKDTAQYMIVITCDSKEHQDELFERFHDEGLACKIL